MPSRWLGPSSPAPLNVFFLFFFLSPFLFFLLYRILHVSSWGHLAEVISLVFQQWARNTSHIEVQFVCTIAYPESTSICGYSVARVTNFSGTDDSIIKTKGYSTYIINRDEGYVPTCQGWNMTSLHIPHILAFKYSLSNKCSLFIVYIVTLL